MPTYILTKKQKELVVEALRESYIKAHQEGFSKKELDTLIEYIDNPYSGSWMGKSNIR
jgi:hypothetical protein